MNIMHHDIGRDKLYKIWNCCDDNMIIYIYKDGGSIVFQDTVYPMQKGTLCFIGANKQHYTMPDKPAEYDRSKIFISQQCVNNILTASVDDNKFYDLFNNNEVIYAIIPSNERYNIENIFSLAEKSKKEKNIASFICCFFSLMTYLKSHVTEHIPAPDNFIFKGIRYINSNFSQNLTLDNICTEIHMSKYHFCRKFKELMGITVMEYLLNTRIAAAKNFLSSTNTPISEISDRCGFSSVSYFCQAFKHNTGLTAIQYRKNLKS